MPSAGLPAGITAGPDGALWYADPGANQIGRITTDGRISTYSRGLDQYSDPRDIVVGPDRNLWFTDTEGIGRITPAGVITEFRQDIERDTSITGIAVGADGNLWYTDWDGDRLVRFSPGPPAGHGNRGTAAEPPEPVAVLGPGRSRPE